MLGTLFYRTSSPFSSKGDTNTIPVCWRKSSKTPVTLSLHHCFFSRMNTKIYFAGANIIAAGAPHDGQTRKKTWNNLRKVDMKTAEERAIVFWSNACGSSRMPGKLQHKLGWTCDIQFSREILGTSVTFTDGVPVFLVSWQKHFQLDITSAFRFKWIQGTNFRTLCGSTE